jgi:2-dehydropantoate 2-reductase
MQDAGFADVAVMGAGAVGCYFGAMLARAGARVQLIGRTALVDAVTQNGLRLETGGRAERITVTATTNPAGIAGAGLVLFCVKSTGTDEAARAIAPRLDPSAIVLSLQNGVDNVARIRAHLSNVVVPAVVYVAAEISAPGVLRHNGGGDLVIGADGFSPADERIMADLAAHLTGAGIPTRVSDNIEGELWAKLVMNCAYNAISAIGRIRYGRVVAVAEARQVMREVVGEIIALAAAKGVRIALDDPVAAMLNLADFVPEAMSSTAQDLGRGRATEIDHLNGYVVRECEIYGLPAPVNRTLHALVKLLERERRPD